MLLGIGHVQTDLHDYAYLCVFHYAPRGTALRTVTGPPAAARPRHARPTQQSSVSPAKERAPMAQLDDSTPRGTTFV